MPDTKTRLTHKDTELLAWQFLLSARDLLHSSKEGGRFLSFREPDGNTRTAFDIVATQQPDDKTCLWLTSQGQWCRSTQLTEDFDTMFDLYLPVLGTCTDAANTRVVAHLGQSVDAQIATSSGDAFYVTGEQNRKHLHCLRALSDAVIVGSGTILADNPQLTTRAVAGENPVRVVIDSHARLPTTLGVFTDSAARTILLHKSSADLTGLDMSFGPKIVDKTGCSIRQVERWVVLESDEDLSVRKIVDQLASQGLRRLFVEGGGITVSRFYEAQVLDRLHVAIAPLLVGQGTPALQLTGVASMMQAHRPPHAIYRMGEDILWDFDVSDVHTDSREGAADNDFADASTSPLVRIL